MTPKRVLFSILNWGLGHVSRSLPIIQCLLDRGHEVTLASDGQAADLLSEELPNVNLLTLPSYGAKYSTKRFLAQHMRLAARIAKAVRIEQEILKKIVVNQSFDVIISDNRYGIFHPSATNVLITHQLSIPLSTPVRQLVGLQIRRYIQRFDVCWVPDVPERVLSGTLSEGPLSIPKRYIGPLSRFSRLDEVQKYDLAVVLSGPEPQRTMLEIEVFKQLGVMDGNALVVLGTRHSKGRPPSENPSIEVQQLLTGQALNRKICQAKYLLSRSGYSTIMDLNKLSKPAILIPTPGQPEQNYLAKLHTGNPLMHFQSQSNIDLNLGISRLDESPIGRTTNNLYAPIRTEALLKEAIEEIGL